MTRDEMHIKVLSRGIDSQTIKGSMTVLLLGHAVDMMMELQDAHEAELKAKDEEIENLKAMVQKMKCCENCESWRRVEMGGELQNFGDCTCNVGNIPRTEGITQSDFYCKYYTPKEQQ